MTFILKTFEIKKARRKNEAARAQQDGRRKTAGREERKSFGENENNTYLLLFI